MKFTINKFLILLIIIVSFYVIFSNLTESKTQESRIAKKVEAMLSGPNVEYDATRIIVKYKDGSTSQKALKVKNKNNFLKQSSSESIELYFQQLDQKKNVKRKKAETAAEKDKIKDKLIEYLGLPDVEYAQPNYIYHSSVWTVDATTAKPGDYNNANHWYYSLAKLPELWQDQGCGAGPDCGGSNTVTVAVIDSGLAYEAYDDSGVYSYYDDWGHVNNGKNFTGVSSDHTGGSFYLHTNPGETPADGMDNDCNGIVDDYNGVDMYAFYDIDYFIYPSSTCPGGTPTAYNAPEDLFYRKPGHPTDTFAHGTFVTGLIAGVVDNELSATGTVSPAFNVKIMPIAANIPFLNSFYTYDIVNAIDYAVFYGADVINLSLGSSSPDFYMEQAINTAYNNGVTVVAASGNNGSGTLDYPARYDKVVSVGAINSDNSKTGYSQYGNGLDLVAYVGQGSGAGTATFQKTWSCFGGCTSGSTFDTIQNKYGVGTSFATPQVSALAALIKSNDPSKTPDQILDVLQLTATDIGTAGRDDNFGYGVINYKAGSYSDWITEIKNGLSQVKSMYLPAYRWDPPKYLAWMIVGNPSTSNSINVYISHTGNYMGSYTIPPTIKSEVNGGPDETAGITTAALDTKFYYPAFRWDPPKYLAWIIVGNPSASHTANIEIKHTGVVVYTGSVLPGQRIGTDLGGVQRIGGPVEVTVTNGVNVYTTIKSEVNGLPDETPGIPNSAIATKFYYPAFRWDPPKYFAWIIVGNPSTTQTANIEIKHTGAVVYSGSVLPGQRIGTNLGDTLRVGGPVEVTVTNGVNVYTTIKSEVNGWPDETEGISNSSID